MQMSFDCLLDVDLQCWLYSISLIGMVDFGHVIMLSGSGHLDSALIWKN